VLEAAANIGEGFSGAFGVGIVSSDAFVAGVGSVPNPLDDQDWPGWLYCLHWSLHASTATISDGVNTGRISVDVDSKAMRRFRSNEAMFASMQVTEVGTAQVEVFWNSRTLDKLP